MILPSELEQLILKLIDLPHFNRCVHAVSKKRVHDIRKQLYKLSADFAQLKPTADRYYDAYFIYNFPMNVMKVMTIVHELQYLHPSLFCNKSEFKILDVSCGEGAGLFGTYYSLRHATRLSMTGIDLSRHMLERCQRIVGRLSKNDPHCKVRLHRQNVTLGFF
jgi:2-polyprenyl-3-methyl-5-hydroxy-6-metoxy-1,4-benzoquinol methylase